MYVILFNGPVEIGLRALSILRVGYPSSYSLQRLLIYDYLIVHSDDLPGGPKGLHPKTPHRSSELLVRRNVLQEGLLLYHGRGLVEHQYTEKGVYYSATEKSAAFLDSLNASYYFDLQGTAVWLVDAFKGMSDAELTALVNSKLGEWGAEFIMESVLSTTDN